MQWASTHHDSGDRLAAASPKRALVVFPMRFIQACLDNPKIDCSMVLALNMLAANMIPASPANGFSDLMLGVRRVVPK